MYQLVVLVLFLAFGGGSCTNTTFPFGVAVGDTETLPNDDGSSTQISLPFPMLFYGEDVSSLFQNTNGDITFDSPYFEYTPELIPSNSVPPMIAIYWTDIDTRNGGDNQNELFVRASTDPQDTATAEGLVHRLGGEAALFSPGATVVATWHQVEAFSRQVGEQNTFQLIVAYDDQKTYVIFDYRQLEFWESDTSMNTVIGFNDNLGIEGSLIATLESNEDMEALLFGTNIDLPGTYVYRVDQSVEVSGCGILSFEPIARPTFGPQVGGSVIQVQNLPVCLGDNSTEIHCRFSGDQGVVVKPGYLVKEDTIECVTPFWGVEADVELEYAVHDPELGEFNSESAEWVKIRNGFQYSSSESQVLLEGSSLPGVVYAGEDITVEWSGPSLIELALLRLSLGDAEVQEEEIVSTLRVLAYKNGEFVEVQNEQFAGTSSEVATLSVNEAAIDAGGAFAVIQFQVEAAKDYGGGNRIGAVKSSGLHVLYPAAEQRRLLDQVVDERVLEGTCPGMEVDDCPALDDTPPCPPDYATANADPNFDDDQACTFPDGAGNCDVRLDILLDTYLTCLVFGATAPSFCTNAIVDFLALDKTACLCNYFHNGAAGCVRDRGSQCCYSPQGALITGMYHLSCFFRYNNEMNLTDLPFEIKILTEVLVRRIATTHL